MRFGRTLRTSIYPPWKDEYIDYAKLKALLREDRADDDDVSWTEDDENRFCDETFNVQLEKVAKFQEDTVNRLRERVDAIFETLKGLAPAEGGGDGKGKEKSEISVQRLKDIESELDQITNEVRELKKYSNLNYTGFLKIVKKHDRKRGDAYKIRPMMQVSLARRPFNSEKGYSPLLNKLSLMYDAIHQYLNNEVEVLPVDLDTQPETHNGERYTAHKCEFSGLGGVGRVAWCLPLTLSLPSLGASRQSHRGQDDDPETTAGAGVQRIVGERGRRPREPDADLSLP